MTLDDDDLNSILFRTRTGQNITPSELRELIRVWERAGFIERGTVEDMAEVYKAHLYPSPYSPK